MLPLMVPLQCINESAMQFHVPAKLIIAVLEVERGKVGQIVSNKNGTYDIGPGQINSVWLPELVKRGINEKDIQWNACLNVKVTAWILAKKIAMNNNLLVGIGAYHSNAHGLNQKYYQKIRINYMNLNSGLPPLNESN